MDNATSFAASCTLVLDEIKHMNAFRRSARAKHIQFATDVCLVAHGVRSVLLNGLALELNENGSTGYLVDTVFPSDPKQIFATLLKALRAKSSVFKHVVWWHHAPAMQSFVVHTPLLQKRLSAVLGGVGDCLFVKLDKPLSAARQPPDKLREALLVIDSLMLKSPDALALSLSDTFTEEILIPLAAVMIEYPVAYCPPISAQASFLEGEPLDICTVSLKAAPLDPTGKEHVLLKFSCPHVLASHHIELASDSLIEKLQLKFTARLERIGMHILVTHYTETLDRVAL